MLWKLPIDIPAGLITCLPSDYNSLDAFDVILIVNVLLYIFSYMLQALNL